MQKTKEKKKKKKHHTYFERKTRRLQESSIALCVSVNNANNILHIYTINKKNDNSIYKPDAIRWYKEKKTNGNGWPEIEME